MDDEAASEGAFDEEGYAAVEGGDGAGVVTLGFEFPPVLEFAIGEAAGAGVVEVEEGGVGEAGGLEAGGKVDVFDVGLAGDFGGQERAFFAEVGLPFERVGVFGREDQEAAAVFDEFAEDGEEAAIGAFEAAEDDDPGAGEVGFFEAFGVDGASEDEVAEGGDGSAEVGGEGEVEEVEGTGEGGGAGGAIEEHDGELVADLDDGVEGIVVGEGIAFEADGEGVVAEGVEGVGEVEGGFAIRGDGDAGGAEACAVGFEVDGDVLPGAFAVVLDADFEGDGLAGGDELGGEFSGGDGEVFAELGGELEEGEGGAGGGGVFGGEGVEGGEGSAREEGGPVGLLEVGEDEDFFGGVAGFLGGGEGGLEAVLEGDRALDSGDVGEVGGEEVEGG